MKVIVKQNEFTSALNKFIDDADKQHRRLEHFLTILIKLYTQNQLDISGDRIKEMEALGISVKVKE